MVKNSQLKKSYLPLVLLVLALMKVVLLAVFWFGVWPMVKSAVAGSESVQLNRGMVFAFVGGGLVSAVFDLGLGVYFWRWQNVYRLERFQRVFILSSIVLGLGLFGALYWFVIQSVVYLLYQGISV